MLRIVILSGTFFLCAKIVFPTELTSKRTTAQNEEGKDSYSANRSTAVHSKLDGQEENSTAKTFPGYTLNANNPCSRNSHNMTQVNSSQGYRCILSPNSTSKSPFDSGSNEPLSFSNKMEVMAFSLILVVGVFGNAYVLFTFGYTFKKRTVTETMLLYLASVDLVASLVNPLLYIYLILTRYRRWDFGVAACKILKPIAPVATTASSAIIIIICVDRYRSIVTPFKRRFSQTQVHILSTAAILISIVFYSYYISALSINFSGVCQVQEVGSQAYSIPNITITLAWDLLYIVVFVPSIIRIFMHLKVSKELQSDVSYWVNRRRANRNVMRILLTVGVTFAILVFPKDILHLAYTISWEVYPNDGIPHTHLLLSLNSWFKVLQVSNSCVNIFIYSKMHERFRNEIANFFRKLLRRPALPRVVNESTEIGTSVSMEFSEANGGGLFRKISDRIKRLSPRAKKKPAGVGNGDLVSLTPSPRARKFDENGKYVVPGAQKKREMRVMSNGNRVSSDNSGFVNGKEVRSESQLLIPDQLNVDGEEERYSKANGNVHDREPKILNDNIRKGLLRINQYSFNEREGNGRHYSQTLPRYQAPTVEDDADEVFDGREVAKLLEDHKKGGIKSKETNC